jgi:formylglycine-generating enzyme required for sulfatase activity
MKTKSIVTLVIFILLVGGALWYYFRPIPHANKERIEEILKNFVTVDGGTFLMGSPDSLGYTDEVQHSVYVSTFYMQPTEVTQELYELVMETNPSENKAWKDMPVTNVSWEDCKSFTKKLNEITDKEYRLPTEAEWEYAARGGAKSQGYLYAGSNNLDEVGWFKDNSGDAIHVVAEKRFNELGLYDMSGNVWEWCSDWHGPYRLDTKGSDNPKGPDNGEYRVLRGGGYYNPIHTCRSANRSKPTKYRDSGFRLVLSEVR